MTTTNELLTQFNSREILVSNRWGARSRRKGHTMKKRSYLGVRDGRLNRSYHEKKVILTEVCEESDMVPMYDHL